MAEFFGYNPPFLGGAQNVLSRQEDIRLIKNDILQLLLTIPGERTMRPEFGVNLRNFVFEVMDEAEIAELKIELHDAIARFEPRVYVESVELLGTPDDHRLRIEIRARLKKDPTKEVTVELFLDSSTAAASGRITSDG